MFRTNFIYRRPSCIYELRYVGLLLLLLALCLCNDTCSKGGISIYNPSSQLGKILRRLQASLDSYSTMSPCKLHRLGYRFCIYIQHSKVYGVWGNAAIAFLVQWLLFLLWIISYCKQINILLFFRFGQWRITGRR